MSFMDQYKAPEIDPNSPFLQKAIGDGQGMTLTFVGIQEKVRAEDSQYNKAGDAYWDITFKTEDGKEKVLQQTSMKGKMFEALRSVEGVEPGTKLFVSRTGVKENTRWDLKRMSADGKVEEKSDAPF